MERNGKRDFAISSRKKKRKYFLMLAWFHLFIKNIECAIKQQHKEIFILVTHIFSNGDISPNTAADFI